MGTETAGWERKQWDRDGNSRERAGNRNSGMGKGTAEWEQAGNGLGTETAAWEWQHQDQAGKQRDQAGNGPGKA